MLAPAEPGGKSSGLAADDARRHHNLKVIRTGVNGRLAAQVVAVQMPIQAFTFVEVAVVVEVHPSGKEAATKPEHSNANRVGSDDDRSVIAHDRYPIVRFIGIRQSIWLAVDLAALNVA